MEYARIVDGRVVELIAPMFRDDGQEVAITDRFSAEMVAQMVDVSSFAPRPSQGDVAVEADGAWSFAPYVEPPLSSDEIRARNAMQRDLLLKAADLAVAPLQDAVDLEIAEPSEVTLLKQWKQYRVAVNRVDLSQVSPSWPAPPVAPDYAMASPDANA